MNNKLINIDPAERIRKVTHTLKDLSAAYAYKMPTNPKTALDVIKFVCDNFPSLTVEEIPLAFEMAVMGKIDVKIEAYGNILNIPILGSVLRVYLTKKNLDARNRQSMKEESPKVEEARQNMEARLKMLDELQVPGKQLRFYHYEIIDQFIQKFKDQDKIDLYEKKLGELFVKRKKENEEERRNFRRISKKDFKSLEDAMKDISFIASVKIDCQVTMAMEYMKKNMKTIDFESVKKRIVSFVP